MSEISSVATEEDVIPRAGELRNVMREDVDAYLGGEFTERILNNAPRTEDHYVKVNQIL